MSGLPIITAVICTRDRAHFLDKCIKSLLEQSLDREKYEILVIDNGSTDTTGDIIKCFADEAVIRSVYEPVIGLSRARNTGWQNAKGQYVGYIDDDAVAEEGWLESALWCFENLSPMPDWVGGPINLDWESTSPDWINQELSVSLGKVYWGDERSRLRNDQRLGGGNSFFPKSRLKELDGFDERLGRKGKTFLSNEETHIQRRIEAQGGSLYYHPGVCIRHFVPTERITPQWFYKRYYWGGISDYIMFKTFNFKDPNNDMQKRGIFRANQEKNRL
ncbi:MAG: glycosyltransferase family 2 protein [Planctomycetes bacterium]|nr:glycosyltransferase family 2 protein [Planctomycetota bacterium]